MQDPIDREWKECSPFPSAVQTRSQGLYFPAWAKGQFGMPEKKVAGLGSEWLMNEFLSIDTADTNKKMKGLREVRRLEP